MVAADEVLCLVLAAGQGRRFGSDKRLARLADGTTLLAASVARAREAFAEVRVVVRAGETPASLGLPAQQRLVHSLDASSGMGHSLAAGVAAARNSPARAIAVLLGDMPWIAADTLERLAAMATPEAIVFPLYDGQCCSAALSGTRLRNWTATRARAACCWPIVRPGARYRATIRAYSATWTPRRRSADYFPAFRITNFGFAATCSTLRNSRLSLAW
ncbi:NTP transferase domain-containing protein [Pseudomonas aeruginosa]